MKLKMAEAARRRPRKLLPRLVGETARPIRPENGCVKGGIRTPGGHLSVLPAIFPAKTAGLRANEARRRKSRQESRHGVAIVKNAAWVSNDRDNKKEATLFDPPHC